MSLKVSDAVEDTMSPALLQGTQEMPEKVHIQEIMDVTSEVVNLKGRSKKIWEKHFRSDTSKAIIQVACLRNSPLSFLHPFLSCRRMPFGT